MQTLQNRDFINGPAGLPLMKPPYGRVTAISMESGEHLWVTAVGRGYENNSAISHLNITGDLGALRRIHAITTRNLLITGQQNLSAFNLDNGEKVGEISVPTNLVQGNLMAYELNNKFFIVIPVGGAENTRGQPSELIAFSLGDQ